MGTPSAESVASFLRRSGVGVHPLEWRLPPIETYPGAVAYVQTLPGRLLLFVLFAALMRPLADYLWWATAFAAALVSLSGSKRHFVALICTGGILLLRPEWFDFSAVYTAARQQDLLETLLNLLGALEPTLDDVGRELSENALMGFPLGAMLDMLSFSDARIYKALAELIESGILHRESR